MAVNFGDTLMEGEIAPSVRVQAPVEDNSGAILAQGFQQAANVVGATVGSIFKQNQVDASAKVLTSYENDLLDLADAVDQGADKNWAMIQARQLRRQYMANSPGLQEDFDKVWSNFAGASGLGHVVVEGTVEQQAQDTVTQDAIKLGYPSVEAYREFQLAGQQYAAIEQRYNTIKTTGGIITESLKLEHTQAVAGMARSAFPAAQTQINKARAEIEANPENKAAILSELKFNLGQNIQQLNALTGDQGAYITAPITGLLESFEGWANGSTELGVLENETKLAALQYEALVSNDPVLGPFIANSKLLKSAGVADSVIAERLLTPEVIRALKDGVQDGNVNLLSNTEGNERVTQSVTQLVSQPMDEAGVEEMQKWLGSVVDGAYLNERLAQDGALGYKGTIEVLGSPAMTEFIRKNGAPPAQHADKFVEVLQNNFANEFMPVVKQYWESTPLPVAAGGESAIPRDTPMNQLLDPVWNGTSVEFVPKPEYAQDARVVRLAGDVNGGSNSIGGPLNNLIRAEANVTGVDPKQVWEERYANTIFGLGEEGGAAPVAAPAADAPTIEQFNLEDEVDWPQASVLSHTELPPLDTSNVSVEGINFDSYLPSIRRSESAGNDSAKNESSSATGRYQFLTDTWNELVTRYPNAGLTRDGRKNAAQQEIAIRLFTAENARYLQRNSIPLNNGTLYAAHFLGADGAVNVLKQDASVPLTSILSRRVINANKFLRGMTVADFRSWAQRKGNA